MTIKFKLLGGGLTIGLVLITVLALTIYTFSNLGNGFTDIVAKSDTGVSNARSTETSISKADQSLSDVSKGILEIVDDINKTNMTIKILERKIKTLAGAQAELAESLNIVVEDMPDGDARYALEDAVDAVSDIEETMRREALISLSSTVTKMASFTENITARVNDIKQLANELNDGKNKSVEVVTANEGIRQLSISFGKNIAVSRNLIAAVLGVIIIITMVSVFLLTRSITRPLNRSIQIADGIATGDLNQKVDIQGNDEFGQLGKAMSTMITNLKKDIQKTRNRAEQATRIRLALDVGRTNVIMADTEQKIIYMNDSAMNTLLEAEQDLRTVFTNFSAENLIGTDITALHLNPEKRRVTLQQLDKEQREDIELGGHFLRTYTNPVFSENGERLGVAMEFADRSKEISIEKEVEHITSLATKGDLTQRLNLSDKEGFFLVLGENMNRMLDTVSDALDNIAKTMGTMSRGDLTQKINSDYDGTYAEVKNAVNSTIDRLREIVAEVRESSDIIGVATREVIQGNNNMSQRSEQQASDLEKIASSTGQLTSTVQSNSDNSQTANKLASDARKQSENGGSVVSEAISAMTDISDSSEKITEIIGVIDEIAFQTNLLALNASVEAARAGEQGRGFAVVATEVRNLAQRSASAAKEIKELIVDSEAKVKIGVELVNRSGLTLDSITIAVQKAEDIISEIAASSIEQTHGLEQINQTMRSMDESTQQNAALAEETSAASASMGDQVKKMDHSLKFFQRF